MPKISINIPTYNQKNYICSAIDSALNQTYSNIEINISDDCSTDDTLNIITAKYSNHKNINIIKQERNIGRVKNYQKLLYEICTGEWAINLDGDDFFCDNNYIQNAVQLIATNKEVIMVMAKGMTLDTKTGQLSTRLKNYFDERAIRIFSENELFFDVAEKDFFIEHATCIYHVPTAKKMQFYQYDISSSDWESIFRLIINHKVGFINNAVIHWRKHDNNTSEIPHLDDVVNNFLYIQSPYNYALKTIKPTSRVRKWYLKLGIEHMRMYLFREFVHDKFSFLKMSFYFFTKYPYVFINLVCSRSKFFISHLFKSSI
ncbi:MAG: glycosyltransferase family 2 protein [Saprospiraceae bacterium]|nr:glycosyltransferase family 2 protein [Saprospiraceae bacterium]